MCELTTHQLPVDNRGERTLNPKGNMLKDSIRVSQVRALTPLQKI